jgi:glycosyltransferase involved in cell wall biosynthesis
VAFKLYSETFSKSFSLVYNYIVPRVAKRCLHIITVSHTAKKELIDEFAIPESKILVVYNGISSIFNSNKRVKFKKPSRPYILTVSSHHPRKNYKRLIEAFENLKEKDIDLYVIGNFINHFANKNDYQEQSNIKFLKNISDQQLLGYYQNADLFVFPSLYEGFGIPLIEAMSQNLTCVASDIPVFREIGDESVIYVDPLRIESITLGLKEGLSKKRQINNYFKLEKFDWEKSAKLVSDLLAKSLIKK